MDPNRVYIFDTTLRDGEQSPGCSMNTQEKLRMARALVELGVDVLEAGFPIASDDDHAAVRAVASEYGWVNVAALARCNRADIERAASALEPARRPRIHVFLATSDIHLKYKLRKTREQVLEEVIRGVELARRYTDDVEFSAEDATRSETEYLHRVLEAAVQAGATTINVPDTVGYSVPDEYARFIADICATLRGRAVVSVHCHNDLGLAAANTLAAIEAGARQVECTINGIGERAGNASLEEIVMALKVRNNRLPYTTGVRTELLYPISQLLIQTIGVPVQPNKAIVGKNAFAHEAGIHQDGMLKDRSCYEIMMPQSVGFPDTKLVLGKHSGRHALKARYDDLGYPLTREELDQVYHRFTQFADRRKNICDDDLIDLLEAAADDNVAGFQVDSVELSINADAHAAVKLVRRGKPVSSTAKADDPVLACCAAVAAAAGERIEVTGYRAQLNELTRFTEVELTLTIGNRTYAGKAEARSLTHGATEACVKAVNRHMRNVRADRTESTETAAAGVGD